MRFHRIFAIVLRHLYLMRRSYDRLTDAFYWITLDITIWGLTSLYFQRFAPDYANVVFGVVSGVIMWNMVYRSQIDISFGILEELWNKNLINIFVSPLDFREWLAGLVSLGMVKAILTLMYSSILVWFLYQVNLIRYGWYILLFVPLLFMTGWTLGFLVTSLILRFGTKVQMFAWTLVWIISPVSAIYFPVNVLPGWIQTISKFVPTSYVFEEMRHLLATGQVNMTSLAISLGLNILYLTIALITVRASFRKTLEKGLVKVY